MTAFSYGENVAVFVKKTSDTKTTVEVVSKKALQTTIFAPDWTKDIFKHISAQLKQ